MCVFLLGFFIKIIIATGVRDPSPKIFPFSLRLCSPEVYASPLKSKHQISLNSSSIHARRPLNVPDLMKLAFVINAIIPVSSILSLAHRSERT